MIFSYLSSVLLDLSCKDKILMHYLWNYPTKDPVEGNLEVAFGKRKKKEKKLCNMFSSHFVV